MKLCWIKISLLTIFCHLFALSTSDAEQILNSQVIKKDTYLSGRVVIEGKVVVEKGATLFIEPGTQVFFKYKDRDGDGVSESSLWIYGNIIARGERGRRILFTSYEKDKRWGDWKEIQINHCKGFVFEYAEFQFSEYGLHIHFSEGVVKNSIFRFNNDCTRLGNSKIVFINNLFEKNTGKALNFTSCDITFEENVVRENREGIFVFEKKGNPIIKNNNIYNNFKNIKTGDFFKEELVLEENFIYPPDSIEGKIKVKFSKEPYFGILPDDKDAYLIFSVKTDGFVDGKGLLKDDKFYVPSFDGNIYEIDLKRLDLRKFHMGDFSDSSPIIYQNRLFYQCWNGKIAAIDLEKAEKIFEASFDKSLKDDHRNPSPVIYGTKLVFLSPGGSLVIVDAENLKELYRAKLDGEFRATPLIYLDSIYIPSTDGSIYRLNPESFKISQVLVDASFYASPVMYKDKIVLVDKMGKIFFLNDNMDVFKIIHTDRAFRYQSPSYYRNNLIIASLDGYLTEFNDEKIISQRRYEDIFTSTAVIYKDFAVLTSFYGHIYFVNKDKLIKVKDLGEIQFMPTLYKDIIITGSRANRVYGVKIW